MEDEEENYFVRNGCVDKLLESQTARDQVVVSFPSDHEAVFSGFKILDLEILKNSGINRFHFTFEPTSKTVVVTATLQDTAIATPAEFIRRRNRGPVRIDEYEGKLNHVIAENFKKMSDVLKIEAGPSTFKVYYLQGSLLKLKSKKPELFQTRRIAGKRKGASKI